MTLQQTLLEQYKTLNLLKISTDILKNYQTNRQRNKPFPQKDGLQLLKNFNHQLPKELGDAEAILFDLQRYGTPNTVNLNKGQYYGYVNGGQLPIALASRLIADSWDQNAAKFDMSPIANYLEDICEKWLCQLFRLPEDCALSLVSGTSSAHLQALSLARYHLLQNIGWDITTQGLSNAPNITIYTSRAVHSSILRAARILGFGTDQIVLLDCETNNQLKTTNLPKFDQTHIIVLQAGDVKTGDFDPFQQVCELARANGSWVHIDGAFGLWFCASEHFNHKTKGMQLADSWATDCHKTLNAGYDCGIFLTRHKQRLLQFLSNDSSYLMSQIDGVRDNMDFNFEMSRRARSIELWSILRFLGKKGVCSLVEQLHSHAKLLADLLSKQHLTVANQVVSNQVLVYAVNNVATQKVLDACLQTGHIWVGTCQFNNRLAIRFSICNWMTTKEDIQQTATTLNTVAKQL